MKNAFPYQFLADVVLASDNLSLPRFLREIALEQDIQKFSQLAPFFKEELQESSLQTQQQVDYFLFIVKQSLRQQFYLRNLSTFTETLDLIRHRMLALRSLPVEVNLKGWEAFLHFTENAFFRLLRHLSREHFEREIDQLNWDLFDKAFIPSLSATIGRVYLEERDAEQAAKARLWLHKAILESSPGENLGNYLLMSGYFLKTERGEDLEALDAVLSQFASLEVPEKVAPLFASAAFELKSNRDLAQLSYSSEDFQGWQQAVQSYAGQDKVPGFVKRSLQALLAQGYARCHDLSPEVFSKKSLNQIDQVIQSLEQAEEEEEAMLYKKQRQELAAYLGEVVTEKEIKEVVQFYRKRDDYPTYADAIVTFTQLLDLAGNGQKSYDLIIDLIKRGTKKLEQGGFYLLYRAMSLANGVFLKETEKPGISWMVEILDAYFEQVKEIITLLEEQHARIGSSLIEFFREVYFRFEPVSNFNIRVYFMYQLYAMKLIRLGVLLQGDTLSQRMATQVIQKLESANNPLSFIQADWEEFKNVPNEVRNKTLNQCINISKGDLPKAAEHLDFSYRNLRSYITFKEVNRLGFFLDLHETSNRQLEQGIRLMFYDLYKKGTIFEVVFDMPRFLVDYSQKGFYSMDLERELNIKGTTAKKYIKIMMEIGLIKQDRTDERKHFYRVMRENIMKRLGKDQATLISPETRLPE